jgi:DNA uptake protein ComE-like DNA-binding protein
MTTPIEFIGYVFCFWACWKVFDGVVSLHKKFVSTDNPKTYNYCHDCENVMEANHKLLQENDLLTEQLKSNKKIASMYDEQTKRLSEPSTALKELHKKTTGLKQDNKSVSYPFHSISRQINSKRAIRRINRSSEQELMEIKGIGPTHAKRILKAKPILMRNDLNRILPAPLVNKLIDEFGRGK